MGLLDWLNKTFPPKTPVTHKDLGRNDPCHCGSGKKYKNCHLPRELEKKAAG